MVSSLMVSRTLFLSLGGTIPQRYVPAKHFKTNCKAFLTNVIYLLLISSHYRQPQISGMARAVGFRRGI